MAGVFLNGDAYAAVAGSEPHASITKLSAAQQTALIACLTGGGTLYRHRGVWVPVSVSSPTPRIAGVTVKTLVRDGMLTLTVHGRKASVRLTVRGSWFARALLAETMEPRQSATAN
jgi:hypothetical protein